VRALPACSPTDPKSTGVTVLAISTYLQQLLEAYMEACLEVGYSPSINR
jgi:hypothetical protein